MPPMVPNLPPKSAVANPSKTNALSPLPSKAMSTPILPKSATAFKCPLPRICANSSYKHIEKAYCQGVKHIMYPILKHHLCPHSRASPYPHSLVLVANYLNFSAPRFKRHFFSSPSFFFILNKESHDEQTRNPTIQCPLPRPRRKRPSLQKNERQRHA